MSIATVRPVPRISVQAFCESPDLNAVIETAAADRRMVRAHVKVHSGGVAAATEFFQSAATPNLIIVESDLARGPLEDELARLSEVCDTGTKVVVIGGVNDVNLYRSLINQGVSEYLVTPIDIGDVITTISNLFVEKAEAPLGRTLAFIGAKGGAGSSMLAHNTAWSIARQFQTEVVVVDLDLPFGTAGLDYNQDPTQGIAEALKAPDRLDDTFLDRLLATCSENLSLLAAPANLDRSYDFDENAFEKIIDIAQSSVPAVVLDVPHAWNSWTRNTLLMADDVVVTVEPDLANLRNAKNIIDLLREERPNDAPPHVVVNKSGMTKRPEISVSDLSQALKVKPLAVVPFDAHLFGTAANNGQMIAETDPKSPVVGTFDSIAAAVTGRVEVKIRKRALLPPLRNPFRRSKSA